MRVKLIILPVVFLLLINSVNCQNSLSKKVNNLDNKIKMLNTELSKNIIEFQLLKQNIISDSERFQSYLIPLRDSILKLNIFIRESKNDESKKVTLSNKSKAWNFFSSIFELIGSILLAIHLLKSNFQKSYVWYIEPKLHSAEVEFQEQSNDKNKIAFFGLCFLIVGFAIQLSINMLYEIIYIFSIFLVLILFIYILWELKTSRESRKNFKELLDWGKRMCFTRSTLGNKCQVCLTNDSLNEIFVGFINGKIGPKNIIIDKGLIEMIRVGHLSCIIKELPHSSHGAQGPNLKIYSINDFLIIKTQLINDLNKFINDPDIIKSRIARFSLKNLNKIRKI